MFFHLLTIRNIGEVTIPGNITYCHLHHFAGENEEYLIRLHRRGGLWISNNINFPVLSSTIVN